MNGLMAFTKKEFMEQLRSYKALVLAAVLFVFGMTSPLLAKMMPELFSQLPMNGITITMPEPTYLDAWAQYFKNISQMGILVLVLVFSGTLSQELSKGTLILPLAKGLSRNAVIGSKFAASVVTWTVTYTLSALTCWGYTRYLFGQFTGSSLGYSLFCLWLFGVFLLAVLLLMGAVIPGNYGSLIMTAAVLGILLMLNIAPQIQKFNPVTLTSASSLLLSSAAQSGDVTTAVCTTAALTLLCLLLSPAAFRRTKL